MSLQPDLVRVPAAELFQRIRGEMVSQSSHFSYFSGVGPLNDEDMRDYLQDPLAAIPPSVLNLLPKVNLLLVPYLAKPEGKPNGGATVLVAFDRPPDEKFLRSASWFEGSEFVAAFAIEELEVGDYHYEFYHQLARAAGEKTSPEMLNDYYGILRDELTGRTHGEVDDESWHAKQGLLQRHSGFKRDSKLFRDYAKQSFIDTLTLFLHGICCDIDVETGPRQLPSRHLRRRLKLLQTMFPPPKGYAVFPEDMEQIPTDREPPTPPIGGAERSKSVM